MPSYKKLEMRLFLDTVVNKTIWTLFNKILLDNGVEGYKVSDREECTLLKLDKSKPHQRFCAETLDEIASLGINMRYKHSKSNKSHHIFIKKTETFCPQTKDCVQKDRWNRNLEDQSFLIIPKDVVLDDDNTIVKTKVENAINLAKMLRSLFKEKINYSLLEYHYDIIGQKMKLQSKRDAKYALEDLEELKIEFDINKGSWNSFLDNTDSNYLTIILRTFGSDVKSETKVMKNLTNINWDKIMRNGGIKGEDYEMVDVERITATIPVKVSEKYIKLLESESADANALLESCPFLELCLNENVLLMYNDIGGIWNTTS